MKGTFETENAGLILAPSEYVARMFERLAKLGPVLIVLGALLPWVSVPTGFDPAIVAYAKGHSFNLIAGGVIVLVLQVVRRIGVAAKSLAALSGGLMSTMISYGVFHAIKFVETSGGSHNVHTRPGLWVSMLGGLLTAYIGLLSYIESRMPSTARDLGHRSDLEGHFRDRERC